MRVSAWLRGALVALGLAAAPAWGEEAVIAWDRWGVPHIEADSAEAASYALGWAQARGRGDQLIELLAQGRGRAAEYWGEDYWESDALMWRMGVPQALDALYEAQGADYQARLDAFAAGVNAFAAAHPGAISEERRRALPVSGRDVIGHVQRSINLMFMAGGELQGLQRRLAAEREEEAPEENENGSNGWAIAPSRSESGNALLLMNPHLPWDGFFTWFEAHLRAPGLDIYGVGLLGQALTSILFNQHLGWTHTVNRHDAVDAYRLALAEGGYVFGGEVRAFEEADYPLRVRLEDGSLEQRTLPVQRSVHGPVLATTGDTAYAVRVAGLADPAHGRTFAQYDAMARAETREQWETAFSQLELPMFNAIYADAHGEILYISSGLHPVRSRGDWRFWDDVIDGGDPELLWTGYQPYERLLRVANPPSGFVQNSNEPGYTATIPIALDPADFPGDYIPPEMRTRPQHGIELLLADESIGLDELVAYAHSTRLAMADNILDEMIAAARADSRPEAARAADVLSAWDRRTEAGSRGAALFTVWAFTHGGGEGGIGYAEPWSFERPLDWSDGLADPALAVEALVLAVREMDAAGLPLDIAWGEFARIPDGEGGTLPSGLGLSGLGAFRVGSFFPEESATRLGFDGGTSWVAAIEFGETPRARAILPYGNFARRPEGVDSQLPLFSRGEFREVNFTPAAIEAATVWRERLTLPAE